MTFSKKLFALPGLILLFFLLVNTSLQAQESSSPLTPPEEFVATDAPNDEGSGIFLTWKKMPYDSDTVTYYIYISDKPTVDLVDEAISFTGKTPYKADHKWPFWTWSKNKEYHFTKIGNKIL